MRTSDANPRLWYIVSLFCVIAIGISSFLLYRLSSAASRYDFLFAREIHEQTEVRLLQVGFKKQVQEWKDILLRGRDATDFKTYTDQFHAEDRQVSDTARSLASTAEDPEVRSLVVRFVEAHEKLDAAYAAALARFNVNGRDPYESDRMVRGQDRPPTDLLDSVADVMSRHTGNQVREQNASANRALVASLAVIAALLIFGVHRIVQASRALRESEERYRTLIERSPDAILAVDAGQVIVMCNGRAAELHGYGSQGDLIGLHITNLFAKENAPPPAGNTILQAEYSLRRKDDSVFPGELTAGPLADNQGRPAGSMLIMRDVTERKQAEETRAALEDHLFQARKLESVGRLAGGVAHDFNNLLTVINGYSDMLLRRPGIEDDISRRVQQIRNAGIRAADLTRQLLAFGRKQRIQPTALSLNSVVHEVEAMFDRLLPENTELIMHLEPSLGLVRADAGQIHQVLVNLVINARDAMPEGGKLILETANVELDPEYAGAHPEVVPGPCVLLQVTDTGAGMDEHVCAHIFEPFYSTKAQGAGTGLGLASVYGIVRQSGGWIWVYSEPGKGTSFKIYLPRIEAGNPSAFPDAAIPATLRGRETIMVVEDRDDVRTLAREVLESYGYRILEAANGDLALQIAAQHNGAIDLLLTDAIMPGMNGMELSQRLTRLRPDTRVLFMSGYSENVIFHQGELKPGIAHIAKPLAPEALALKVRETIAAPKQFSAGS